MIWTIIDYCGTKYYFIDGGGASHHRDSRGKQPLAPYFCGGKGGQKPRILTRGNEKEGVVPLLLKISHYGRQTYIHNECLSFKHIIGEPQVVHFDCGLKYQILLKSEPNRKQEMNHRNNGEVKFIRIRPN